MSTGKVETHGLSQQVFLINSGLSSRQVLMLKGLPKLIITDLSGNSLCQGNDYRLYVVYHLKRIKVQQTGPGVCVCVSCDIQLPTCL